MEGLQHLDSFQIVEVLDFVEFLGHKEKERKKSVDHVDLLFGKYKDKLTPSDLFAQLKKVEKEKEEMAWKKKSGNTS